MWVAYVIVVLYVALKIFGVIVSPLSFDLAFLISGAYLLGKAVQKLDYTVGKVDKIGGALVRLGNDFRELKAEHEVFVKKH